MRLRVHFLCAHVSCECNCVYFCLALGFDMYSTFVSSTYYCRLGNTQANQKATHMPICGTFVFLLFKFGFFGFLLKREKKRRNQYVFNIHKIFHSYSNGSQKPYDFIRTITDWLSRELGVCVCVRGLALNLNIDICVSKFKSTLFILLSISFLFLETFNANCNYQKHFFWGTSGLHSLFHFHQTFIPL